jgi:AcrR family transcriptional regulator
VHRTTLHRRWGDKEHLMVHALQAVAAARIDVPDSGDVDEDLRVLARSVTATLTTPEGAGTVRAMVTAATHSTVVRGIAGRFWAERTEEAGVIVSRAVDRGQLPTGTCPSRVVRHLGAPLYHQLLVTLEPLGTDDADLAARATAAAAHAGVFVVQPGGQQVPEHR